MTDSIHLSQLRQRVYEKCVALEIGENDIQKILETVNRVCGGCSIQDANSQEARVDIYDDIAQKVFEDMEKVVPKPGEKYAQLDKRLISKALRDAVADSKKERDAYAERCDELRKKLAEAEARCEKMREAIVNAPHDVDCYAIHTIAHDSEDILVVDEDCDCWKKKAIAADAGKEKL